MNSARPYVICHMMQTLDGKIASGVPNKEILMDFFDLYTETEQKLAGKAWMFGRKTGMAFAEAVNTPLPSLEQKIDTRDFTASFEGETFAIIIDTKGSLRWSQNFISLSNQTSRFHLLIVVTEATPPEYLAYLQQMDISYIVSGKTEPDLGQVMTKLKKTFSIEKILLEGGGSFNGSMLQAKMINELSLLLIPRVLNKKDAPSLFDANNGNIQIVDGQLQSCEQLNHGVLWLRYKMITAEN